MLAKRHGKGAALALVLAVAACAALAPGAAHASIDCTPALQWVWDGNVRAPDQPRPCISPIVVQLTDDDGDGSIDEGDIPDVAFIHRDLGEGRITAVDGLSGNEHFTATFESGLMSTGLAAADIDGDGIVELLAIDDAGEQLVAFENDGAFKWISEPSPLVFTFLDAIAVADLDQDGSPEIFIGNTVFRADGRLAWQGSGGQGRQFIGRVSHAVDLAPEEPGLEVLAGHTLYDAAGGIVWRAGGVSDGWTAVADFDGDGDPDVAHVSIGTVELLDQEGNRLTTTYMFGGTPASQPVAADLDGDGVAELFLMQAEEVRALEFVGGDWAELWSQPTEDPSRIAGSVAFDFDGDGASDVVYHDGVSWYIFDGPTGAILHEDAFLSATGIETPVIADIDNDCVTEILVTGCSTAAGGFPDGVRAYECGPSARARPLWNQFAYHVGNVLDDGAIPQFEPPSWLDHGSWMAQVSTAAGAVAVAAAPTPLRACAGQAVVLDGSPSTGCSGGYEYRFSQGLTPVRGWSSEPTHEVTPTASPAVYTLHVRCSGEPCESQAEVVVELDPQPVADAGPSQLLCTGASTRVGGAPTGSGGAGGHAYLWESSPPGGLMPGEETLENPNTTARTVPTVFTVTVTDAAGCAAEDSVLVDVYIPEAPQSLGSTLRVVKSPSDEDVVLSWSTSDPGTVAFRIHRDWPPAASLPVLGPDVTADTHADTGVLHDGRNHAYEVFGVNCAGDEGP